MVKRLILLHILSLTAQRYWASVGAKTWDGTPRENWVVLNYWYLCINKCYGILSHHPSIESKYTLSLHDFSEKSRQRAGIR